MAKVTVYLPDALYRRVQAAHLPVSKIAQVALEEALAQTLTIRDLIDIEKGRLDVISAEVARRTALFVRAAREAGLDPAEVFGDDPEITDYLSS